MSRWGLAVVVLVVAWGSICAQQSMRRLFPIAGRVVGGGGVKINRAVRVVLRTDGRPPVDVGAMTAGPDGAFRFMAPEGKYTLTAERYGLAPQSYGASSLGAVLGVAIIAGPDQETGNLSFVVHPPSAVFGKVVDETGDPVENALVQLLIEATFGGRRAAAIRGWMYSNDRGEFRFSGLGAGKYYLAATGKPWYSRAGEDTTAYAPVYYPNAGEARAAAPFTLGAGEEFSANLMMRPAPGYSVTVQLPEGNRQAGRTVQLTSEGIGGASIFDRTISASQPLPTIPAVTPGSYVLRVVEDSGRRRLAMKRVEVGSANVKVAIESVEPPSVSASVQVVAQPGGKKLTSLRIGLMDEADRFHAVEAVGADNSVKFSDILPARYRVGAYASERVYVTGLSVGGRPLADAVLDVPANGIADLKIVVTKGTGRVKGFARKNGQIEVGVMVILAPAWRTSDPAFFHGFVTDSDGSYDFEGVLPGEYRLFAAADPNFGYADPEVVRPLMAGATAVKVGEGQTVETSVGTR